MAEKTLLQQIREKELMLNIKIEDTRREAEETILAARKRAKDSRENSEKEGKKAADEYYRKEMDMIRQESEQLGSEAARQATVIRNKGEQGLERAAKLIRDAIFPE